MPERIQKPPLPWGPKQGDGDGPGEGAEIRQRAVQWQTVRLERNRVAIRVAAFQGQVGGDLDIDKDRLIAGDGWVVKHGAIDR